MTYRKCNGSVSRRKFLKGLSASGATIAVGIASAARIHGVGKAWRAGTPRERVQRTACEDIRIIWWRDEAHAAPIWHVVAYDYGLQASVRRQKSKMKRIGHLLK